MQIQLELPDLSRQYEEYLEKQKKEAKKEPETVIIIELF